MVSKASDDLPDPDTPDTTVIAPRGMSTSIALRLCSLAPRTESVVTRTLYRAGGRQAYGVRRRPPVLSFAANARFPPEGLIDASRFASPLRARRPAAGRCGVAPAGLVRPVPAAADPADIVSRGEGPVRSRTRAVAVFDVKAEVKDARDRADRRRRAAGCEGRPAQGACGRRASRTSWTGSRCCPIRRWLHRPLGIVTVSVAVMKTKPSHASELGNQLIMGHGREGAEEGRRLVLRAVARRPLPGLDGDRATWRW